MAIQTVYLKSVYELDKFQKTVNKTVTIAEQLHKKYQFDTIVFCGMSGAAMAFILSHRLRLPLICVRKADDTSHFHGYFRKDRFLEGNLDAKRYLIVDDFIATGRTVNMIVERIHKEVPDAQCVSLLMYADPGSRTWCHPDWKEPLTVYSSRIED